MQALRGFDQVETRVMVPVRLDLPVRPDEVVRASFAQAPEGIVLTDFLTTLLDVRSRVRVAGR